MKWAEGKQYEKAPPGSHIGRCYSVIDMGTQLHKGYQGAEDKLQRNVRISFELPLEKMTGEFDPEVKGKPFAVHLNVKQSLHPKASLRKMLEGWRGKKFDKDSIESFDPRKLVGLAARLSLIENGDFINIDSIAPLGKSEKCPKQVNKSVYFSLDEFDAAVFEAFTEGTRKKIANSPEYKAIVGEDTDEQEHPADDEPQRDDDEPKF